MASVLAVGARAVCPSLSTVSIATRGHGKVNKMGVGKNRKIRGISENHPKCFPHNHLLA